MTATFTCEPALPTDAAAGQGPVLNLTLLGAFSAVVDGVQLQFATRKAKALLAYVALGDVNGESRERLHGLLWSASDEKKARNSLRNAVKGVNHVLLAAGFRGFHPTKQSLHLDRRALVCDVDSVVQSAEQGAAHGRLLDTVRLADSLLGDLAGVDPSFEAWVRAKRHSLHDRLALTLERSLPEEIASSQSVDLGQALLNLDPTNEVACRHLIRARVARGEIGGALKAYKALWDVLDEEFDTEPSAETQDLVVNIKQQAGWSARPGATRIEELPIRELALPAPAPAAHPPLRALYITIGAFDAEGVPDALRYIINGFRHELVATLARFREWSVRTQSSRISPGRADDLQADEYEYGLAASAWARDGGLSLIVTLEDQSGEIVWSQRFTLGANDFQPSQQQIVRLIASSLKINISADRLRRGSGGGSLPPGLYDQWLRGQEAALSFAQTSWGTAKAIFERLVQDAPMFSPAYSGLAQTLNSRHIIFPGRFRDRQEHAEALQIGQRAVHLDPSDARAHLCVAWGFMLAGRFAEATLHAGLVVELNPNDPWPQIATAQIFAYCGDHDRASALAARSFELMPTPTSGQLAYASAIHFLAGRYERSAEIVASATLPTPAFSIWPIAALSLSGRTSEAAEAYACMQAELRRIWAGDPPSGAQIDKWLMHIFPIAEVASWERLRRGLAAAGASVADLEFGDW